jgi:hypothetical protein
MIDGRAHKRAQRSVGFDEGCRAIEPSTVNQHVPENDKTHCHSEEEYVVIKHIHHMSSFIVYSTDNM